jgi:hypothetical protein
VKKEAVSDKNALGENAQLPEVYTSSELDVLEAHITQYFGELTNVFHEIISPDIHVDICIIEPIPERNFYTLVTMGMGACRMNVIQELADRKLDRAELLVMFPADWKLPISETINDEKWYWPLRWLKVLARFPCENDT